MRKLILFVAVVMMAMSSFAQEEEFSPNVKLGVGLIGQTSYQKTSDNYLMEYATLKKGFVHSNIFLTPKLSGRVLVALQTPQPKLFDFVVRYEFSEFFALQAGRFKGAGPRSHFQESIYDQEFSEIPFAVTEFARGLGVPDFRRKGIEAQGKWSFINYKLFWHDGDGMIGSPPSQQFVDVNQNQKGNVGFKLTNFDLYLSLTPLKNTEFGGHIGRASLPGMGRKSIDHHSLFFYYKPDRWEFKLDYLAYPDVIFEEELKPAKGDYSLLPYQRVNKKGYSLYTGYNVNEQWKLGLRYEHFDHGPLGDTPSIAYENLNIYTAGVTFFPIKGNKRNKLVLFYERFDERKTAPGFSRPNDIVALAYQVFLVR